METIGAKMSEIRRKKGISQEELSDQSKINLRTLQRIEKNQNEPRGATLKSIREVLQINIEDLLAYGKTEDKNYLIFPHLSPTLNVIFPLGNIILPLILWLNKRDNTTDVDNQGKNILNFQILFSIVNNTILIISIYAMFSQLYNFRYFIYSYYILILFNAVYSIYVATKIKSNKIKNYYPNPIIFFKIKSI